MAEPSSEKVPHTFCWAQAGSTVRLTADFFSWGHGVQMAKSTAEDGSPIFVATVDLTPGLVFAYKFVVDGKWVYDSELPWETDVYGNINNVLYIDPITRAPAEPPRQPPTHLLPTTVEELHEIGSGEDTDSPWTLGDVGRAVARSRSRTPSTDACVESSASPLRASEIAEWMETAAGFADSTSSERRRRMSVSAAGAAAEKELASEFALEVERRTPMARSMSMASLLSDGGKVGTLAGAGGDDATASVEPLTPAQATVRREGKMVFAMVGLPARGKTYIARKLYRHLSWMGYNVCYVNVGNYRRKILGPHQPHDFFDPRNEDAAKKRTELARFALDEMTKQLRDGADIAIFDATNSTRLRRKWLRDELDSDSKRLGVKYTLVFVESICTDEKVIAANIRETKLKSPDYQHEEEESAVSDFLKRIEHYVMAYEPVDDTEDAAYIKLIDVGRQLMTNRLSGYLNGRVLFFLQNLNISPRPIWITRHGESQNNVLGRIGGDTSLAPRGQLYAQKLAEFMNRHYPPGTDLTVWTSCLKRTAQTAAHIHRDIVQWRGLDEIDAGICDGMTYEEIAEKMPHEYKARAQEKFCYRYPRGESYQDIVHRLEPVIIELMRQQGPVLIVSHQATLRVLYAYLTFRRPSECPSLPMPLHTVIQLTPRAYGCEEVRHELHV